MKIKNLDIYLQDRSDLRQLFSILSDTEPEYLRVRFYSGLVPKILPRRTQILDSLFVRWSGRGHPSKDHADDR